MRLQRKDTPFRPSASGAGCERPAGPGSLQPPHSRGRAARTGYPPRALGQLVSYGLLLRPTDRYETGHALIHTYARRRLAAPDELLIRLAGYYDALAREQRELGPPGYAVLDGERSHLLTVLERCVERGAWEAARGLVWAVGSYLDIQGHWTERVAVLEMGVTAAQALEHRYDEGAFSGNLGSAYSALGRVEAAKAHLAQSLAIFEEIKSPHAELVRQWLAALAGGG